MNVHQLKVSVLIIAARGCVGQATAVVLEKRISIARLAVGEQVISPVAMSKR
jgi:hypothetical protein